MEDVYHTKLGEGRRVAIPAEVCEKLGLNLGDPLTIQIDADGMHLLPFAHTIREVQAAFAPYRKPGISEVDELMRERKEETGGKARE